MDLNKIFEDHRGPPVNIEGIIRSMGIELDKKAELDAEIAGQIERLADGRYKISANKDHSYFRQRFTMAHELGHFLFHQHLIGDGVDDSIAYRSTPDGRFYNQRITRRHETQANQFAAGVLMPTDLVEAKWADLGDLDRVAKVFQVSKQAMEIRLKGMDIDPTAENLPTPSAP